MLRDRKYEGFSLIEILIVVGLILILAAVTIVAINPAKHFQDTRNAERSADVSEILNAVTQYLAEGAVEGDDGLDGLGVPLCEDEDGVEATASIGKADVDLESILVDEYIVEIPTDPSDGDAEETGYEICRTLGGRIEISAPNAEGDEEIAVRR